MQNEQPQASFNCVGFAPRMNSTALCKQLQHCGSLRCRPGCFGLTCAFNMWARCKSNAVTCVVQLRQRDHTYYIHIRDNS